MGFLDRIAASHRTAILLNPFVRFIKPLLGLSLIVRSPMTLVDCVRIFAPGGFGIGRGRFWAFGAVDGGFRSWYDKISRDYASRGRFGYAWDDGLGMALGSRIYNNWLTYWLNGVLGARLMMGLGLLALVAAAGLTASAHWGPMGGVLLALLLAGSPAFMSIFTHLGKPEAFWYGLAYLAAHAAYEGNLLAFASLWTGLSIANTAASVMVAVALAPVLAHGWVTEGCPWIPLLVLGVGVAKQIVRFAAMFRMGWGSRLAREQSAGMARSFSISQMVFGMTTVSLTVGSVGVETGTWLSPVLAGLGALALHAVNIAVVKLNDEENVHGYLIISMIALSVATGSLIGAVVALLAAYGKPLAWSIPFPSVSTTRDVAGWRKYGEWAVRCLRGFPFASPMAYPEFGGLADLFRMMPPGSRCLIEDEPNPRFSPYRRLWLWAEELFSCGGIDPVHEIYTRATEPELFSRRLALFREGELADEQLRDLVVRVGASHVIAKSDGMEHQLTRIGFTVLGTASICEGDAAQLFTGAPPCTLRLLSAPAGCGLIEPWTEFLIGRSEFSWKATAGVAYCIKLRHARGFEARQVARELPVELWQPFADCPTTFMKVQALTNDVITLRFRGSCLG